MPLSVATSSWAKSCAWGIGGSREALPLLEKNNKTSPVPPMIMLLVDFACQQSFTLPFNLKLADLHVVAYLVPWKTHTHTPQVCSFVYTEWREHVRSPEL